MAPNTAPQIFEIFFLDKRCIQCASKYCTKYCNIAGRHWAHFPLSKGGIANIRIIATPITFLPLAVMFH